MFKPPMTARPQKDLKETFSLIYEGPPLGGYLVRSIGFHWVMVALGALSLLYAPLLGFLRMKKSTDEQIVNKSK